MQEPLTHFPLKVQSFGHRCSTTSNRKGEISDFSPLLSLTREDRFLPTIPPHSFKSKEAADIAQEASPVSYKERRRLWLTARIVQLWCSNYTFILFYCILIGPFVGFLVSKQSMNEMQNAVRPSSLAPFLTIKSGDKKSLEELNWRMRYTRCNLTFS